MSTNAQERRSRDLTNPDSGSLVLRDRNDRARILIVDDDERNLLALKTVLEDLADVVVAKSGEEALRHLLKGEFAVILLDVYMPGIDGYETAKIIRDREQTKRIPIVFLSAVNKETEHQMRGYSMGAVDYVFKPVEPIVLRSKVAVFVDLFQTTREMQHKASQAQELLQANMRAHTELLRAEQELRQVEQRQAAILNSLPILVYLEEQHRTLREPRFVSGDVQALTGFSPDEVKSYRTHWHDRIHAEDLDRVIEAMKSRHAKQGYSVEYRWQCANGQYKYFLDQAILLRDEGSDKAEYAGTLLDVSDRKELESQLLHASKMDAIGQLSGGIAHDFNNLLAAVLTGLEILERRIELAPELRRIFDITRRSAQQGTEVVSRLLAFARKQKLEPSQIEMSALSRAVDQLLTHTLGGLVALEWELMPDLWLLYADASQLELALVNLAINARDAMPEGGTIRITCRNATVIEDSAYGVAPGEYVVLSVADTGHGISPALLERVTEPFFTTKDVGKGTGLGLSMVYGFAKQSGGTLLIESEVGQGTCVTLWLPRGLRTTAMSKDSALKSKPSISDTSKKILLVDDHDGVRTTTAALLIELGHHVIEAADGAQALELMRQQTGDVDLVVSDYAMPLLSGGEIIRQLRTKKPGLGAIIITGYADSEAITGTAEGVVILTKPFTSQCLQDAIVAAESWKKSIDIS
ncbi:response regulator [Dyella jejuensis]|uniref:histidine kinase n=1 Tax=Dyella jejuensis TaxID=1432009 RepID=A0ABW8JH75_9GAMM